MEKTLTVGIVLKPQGIRGELKVKPFTDTADVFRSFKRVFMDGVEYKVLSVRIGDDAVYLGLSGVPDRNQAELMRGKEVVVLREDAPDPGEDRYYIVDLLESEVYGDGGEFFGTVKEIRQAATDIYTLEKDGKEILFPAVKGLILTVDLEKKRITVKSSRYREVAVVE